jgi:sulfoxide reductase heme-binding subunit YedZ
MRLSARAWLVLGAALGILIVLSTDQVVPATSAYQAQMRVWLAGRATGITAYLLLTGLVSLGLILSHPTNQSTWKLSKRIFPWHENLFVFVMAFLVAHVVSIILDPYAGVGIAGSFIPGLSAYRSAPVALGTLGLYAALVSGITGRWTKLLPQGLWLRIHRFSLVAWIMSWMHGILAGTDSAALLPIYLATGLLVLAAGAYR